jgi:hypothetical protein
VESGGSSNQSLARPLQPRGEVVEGLNEGCRVELSTGQRGTNVGEEKGVESYVSEGLVSRGEEWDSGEGDNDEPTERPVLHVKRAGQYRREIGEGDNDEPGSTVSDGGDGGELGLVDVPRRGGTESALLVEVGVTLIRRERLSRDGPAKEAMSATLLVVPVACWPLQVDESLMKVRRTEEKERRVDSTALFCYCFIHVHLTSPRPFAFDCLPTSSARRKDEQLAFPLVDLLLHSAARSFIGSSS